ncbi:SCO3242 family prenyltransferase [Georgenia soli]|uniref:SCO3242 family prenyltransferase n=1 Tax=Georgenia soli TaxID=638953 RepID=UPI001FE86ED9|nr:UbiA family prenyltransferase [Georgenia soli]
MVRPPGADAVSTARDLAELVRLPAALSVPGDTLAGAAAAGWPLRRRTLLAPLSSVSLYLAGMALNDYADRHLDATERPERPIPSGRVSPRQALALAAGLTGAGVALAAGAGRGALAVAVPLAGVVWGYDMLAKPTVAGPVFMGAARGLDVLLGAGGSARALPPALALAAHTMAVTALSRGEVHGTRPVVARAAAATTGATALGVVVGAATAARAGARADAPSCRGRAGTVRRVLSALTATALAGSYAASVGRAQLAAVASPDAGTVRRATGTGIRGMLPLQAALASAAGHPVLGGALVGAVPALRAAARKVATT